MNYLEKANLWDIIRGKAIYLYDDNKNITDNNGFWYKIKNDRNNNI